MQTVELNHHVQGDEDAPAVVLVPSLGTTLAMWDAQADLLAPTHRVVRVDTRGHGSSPTPEGPYTMSELAADVVAVADGLGMETFSYVGLSLGGAIGQVLALEHPNRLESLVLACTGPRFGDPATWHERAALVAADGVEPLVEGILQRWFTPEFRATNPKAVSWVMDMVTDTSPIGYAGCCGALADFDVSERLREIKAPTLVISGGRDPGTPPVTGRAMADGIPGAEFVVVDDAAHIANVSDPEPFNRALLEHLGTSPRMGS